MSQLNFFQRQSRAEHKDQESKQSSSTSDHKCLNGGCIGSSESTLVKIQYCWKSHILTHIGLELAIDPPPPPGGILYTMIF